MEKHTAERLRCRQKMPLHRPRGDPWRPPRGQGGSPEHDEMEAKGKLRQEQEQEDLKRQQELANAMGDHGKCR